MPTLDELKAAADKAAAELEAATKAAADRAAELAANPSLGNLLHDLLMEIANALGNNPKVEAALTRYKAAVAKAEATSAQPSA